MSTIPPTIAMRLDTRGHAYLLKAGWRWGAIRNYIRAQLRIRKTPFTYHIFCGPFEPYQIRASLKSLCILGEIQIVRPGKRSRHGHPPIYRAP